MEAGLFSSRARLGSCKPLTSRASQTDVSCGAGRDRLNDYARNIQDPSSFLKYTRVNQEISHVKTAVFDFARGRSYLYAVTIDRHSTPCRLALVYHARFDTFRARIRLPKRLDWAQAVPYHRAWLDVMGTCLRHDYLPTKDELESLELACGTLDRFAAACEELGRRASGASTDDTPLELALERITT